MIEFAKSMAGHDRNHIYLVTGKDERFVYLADGNVKLLAEPKKKNRKHIQIIHRLPEEVLGCLEQEVTDLTVKRAIKAYARILKEMCIRDSPEIEYDKVDKVRGMDIIFVTTAKTDEEARELLTQFNMPFAK